MSDYKKPKVLMINDKITVVRKLPMSSKTSGHMRAIKQMYNEKYFEKTGEYCILSYAKIVELMALELFSIHELKEREFTRGEFKVEKGEDHAD